MSTAHPPATTAFTLPAPAAKAKPLESDRGEKPKETTVRKAEERAALPEVAHVLDGMHIQLRYDETHCDEADAQRARQPEVIFRRVGDHT